ncbi:MAG TPA: hypothetical protein ENN30_02360 [Candidatus Woesearchaeota archaeon]|nr:hypothetical protein [Candidatus Woesearchaeota archaeon]
MALFGKDKTIVEKYEEQFKVEEMQNKHIFYDLYARVGDPEELRGFTSEILRDMDWKTTLNELTKFDEMELEGIFRGGRLKPFKNIIKTYKSFKKGPRIPWLWKALALTGFIFLGVYIYTILRTDVEWTSNIKTWLMIITPLWFIASITVYSIKETVQMAIWVKTAGVYDVASEEADLRIVIAADAEKKDKEAFNMLESDVAEFYNTLTRKYVKKVKREETKTEIKQELQKDSEDPAVKVIKALKDIDKQIANLEKSFVAGKMKEATYQEIKGDLEKRKSKLETISDLLNI